MDIITITVALLLTIAMGIVFVGPLFVWKKKLVEYEGVFNKGTALIYAFLMLLVFATWLAVLGEMADIITRIFKVGFQFSLLAGLVVCIIIAAIAFLIAMLMDKKLMKKVEDTKDQRIKNTRLHLYTSIWFCGMGIFEWYILRFTVLLVPIVLGIYKLNDD